MMSTKINENSQQLLNFVLKEILFDNEPHFWSLYYKLEDEGVYKWHGTFRKDLETLESEDRE